MLQEIEDQLWHWRHTIEKDLVGTTFRRLKVEYVNFIPIRHDVRFRFHIRVSCRTSPNIITNIERIHYTIRFDQETNLFKTDLEFFDPNEHVLKKIDKKNCRSFVYDIKKIDEFVQNSFRNVLKNESKTRLHYSITYNFEESSILKSIKENTQAKRTQ